MLGRNPKISVFCPLAKANFRLWAFKINWSFSILSIKFKADAGIRVPIVTIISTRIIRIALQTRISTDLFWSHFMKIRVVFVFQSFRLLAHGLYGLLRKHGVGRIFCLIL